MIDKFIAEVKNRGLARSNRFLVEFDIPGGDRGSTQLAQLFCDSVSIPGMDIASTPQRIFGEPREMPYERMFSPIVLSFYVDADMKVKYLFDSWIHKIINPVTRNMSYYDDYKRNITIKVLTVAEDEDNPPYEIVLWEAWPKNVTSIVLDSTSNNPMKLQITFQYKYWEYTSKKGLLRQPNDFSGLKIDSGDPMSVNTGQGLP